MKRYAFLWGWLLTGFLVFQPAMTLGSSPGGTTVEKRYPSLALGILKGAHLEDLDRGLLLQSEGIRIEEGDIEAVVQKAPPYRIEERDKNRFFLLEKEARARLLVREARASGIGEGKPDRQALWAYLDKKTAGLNVTDDEVEAYYRKNRDAFDQMPFKKIKESLRMLLLMEKKGKALRDHEIELGRRIPIRVNAGWVEAQYGLFKDNPVDRARATGIPSLVEFGSTGCPACVKMIPVLKALEEKYGPKLNIVKVDIKPHKILGERYCVRTIPVQVFFDREGQERYRHLGFMPGKEIEKILSKMGVR